MSYKDEAAKSRVDKLKKYADGGIATKMQGPSGDKMFELQTSESRKGRVAPLARQVFESGEEGPLNITPNSIPGDTTRK